MSESRIIAARRTAVVPRNGAFADLELHHLAGPVIAACLEDCGLRPDAVDEVIVSNALGAGGNVARSVALYAGLPERVGGLTIDRQCAGGLDALIQAHALVASGMAEVVLAGGVESYSRQPLRSRTFADGRPPEPFEQARFTPWPDRDPDMISAAAALADRFDISRTAQEDWAVRSHRDALADKDRLRTEIVPVSGQISDPFARQLTANHCARIKSLDGTITAATTSVAADAAAFCVVVSDRLARELGMPSLSFVGGRTLGAAPDLPGIAPIAAIKQVLEIAELKPDDLDQIELMEAFAVQAILCAEGSALPRDRINPRGGSLARGHPIGASGTILAVRLFHDLRLSGGHGLAAIAAAGGLGTALVVEGRLAGQ